MDELNVINESLNIMLNFKNWRSHTHPDVGSYAQSVITEQIGDYDIFIGILWTRFGTSTPKTESGTEEELNNAMKKYENGEKINIMLYFSDEKKSIQAILTQMNMKRF